MVGPKSEAQLVGGHVEGDQVDQRWRLDGVQGIHPGLVPVDDFRCDITGTHDAAVEPGAVGNRIPPPERESAIPCSIEN